MYDTTVPPVRGQSDRFETTCWSEILSSRTVDEAIRRTVVSKLAQSYWYPIYCYLRRKGYDTETAKDLVQGFFADVVMERRLFQQADPAKGRLRTLLLTALTRYAVSSHRATHTQKRHPVQGIVSLNNLNWAAVREPAHNATPEEAYTESWASALIDTALEELRAECRQEGRTVHWQLFDARVLQPILRGAQPVQLSELCIRHGIETEHQASDAVAAVKHRFRSILWRHVRLLVGSEAEADQEIDDLIGIFSRKGGG